MYHHVQWIHHCQSSGFRNWQWLPVEKNHGTGDITTTATNNCRPALPLLIASPRPALSHPIMSQGMRDHRAGITLGDWCGADCTGNLPLDFPAWCFSPALFAGRSVDGVERKQSAWIPERAFCTSAGTGPQTLWSLERHESLEEAQSLISLG